MALVVTHVLIAIILVDLYRDYVTKHKKYFTLHTVLIGGIAGLLPDLDIPLSWILTPLGISLNHGTITHTPLFGLIFLIPAFYLWQKKKHKMAVYFFVTTFGILLHILLDLIVNEGGYMLLHPISQQVFSIGLMSFGSTVKIAPALDAIILLTWLYHEERKHKISDFI